MSKQIQAVYERGVIRPLEPVALSEGMHVTVQLPEPELTKKQEPDWLVQLKNRHEELRAKYGEFPDSTALIREDRDRDI